VLFSKLKLPLHLHTLSISAYLLATYHHYMLIIVFYQLFINTKGGNAWQATPHNLCCALCFRGIDNTLCSKIPKSIGDRHDYFSIWVSYALHYLTLVCILPKIVL
jgi:hypothetical protein